MHLIEPLVVGIRGAESGTADIYRRGTSTRITYYTTYEGDGSTLPSGAVDLDTNGGGEFYVNETADVVVRDSSGTEVRRFTSASSAAAVEVISPSFTGTDYDTAATGLSEPVSLKTLLDLWVTNAGATDWKVSVGGVATTLLNAFSVVGAAFINVKGSAYGATGDGSTDDTAAIQAALDAAGAASGGTVYFPPGTYKITSALSVSGGTSLQGAGPGASIIRNDNGSNGNAFTYAVYATYPTSIVGLRIYPSTTNDGNVIQAHSGNIIRMTECYIGSSFMTGRGVSIDAAGTIFSASNSVFEVGASGVAANRSVASNSSAASIGHLYNCKFVYPGSVTLNGTTVALVGGSVVACTFATTTITAGSHNLVFFAGDGSGNLVYGAAVIGCVAPNPTGGTVNVGTTGVGLFQAGNVWGSALVHGALTQAGAKSNYYGQHRIDTDTRRFYSQDDGAAVSISPTQYGEIEIERTNNGAQTVTLASPSRVNQTFIFQYNNEAHGSATGTITVSTVKGLATFTVDANKKSTYLIAAVHNGAAAYWVLLGSQVNWS